MTGNQLKAARSLIGWTQAELAQACQLSIPTVKRAEGSASLSASEKAVEAIQAALEQAGVQFIAENGGGAGVRLRKPLTDPDGDVRELSEDDLRNARRGRPDPSTKK